MPCTTTTVGASLGRGCHEQWPRTRVFGATSKQRASVLPSSSLVRRGMSAAAIGWGGGLCRAAGGVDGVCESMDANLKFMFWDINVIITILNICGGPGQVVSSRGYRAR